MQTLSVVLLQYRLPELTRVALESLTESHLQPDETIVVDNGSPEDEKAWLRREKVALIENSTNLFFSGGTNVGWKAAKGDYILLCNNDIAFSRQCLDRLVSSMDLRPDLGWLSACYTAGPWSVVTVAPPADILNELDRSGGARRDRFNTWAESLGDQPDIRSALTTEFTVVLIRKKASDQCGYFVDNLLWHHSHDLAIRYRMKGWNIGIARNAVFWHSITHPTLKMVEAKKQGDDSYSFVQFADDYMEEHWGKNWRTLF